MLKTKYAYIGFRVAKIQKRGESHLTSTSFLQFINIIPSL